MLPENLIIDWVTMIKYIFLLETRCNKSNIGLNPGERGMQRCEPYLSFSVKAWIYSIQDFLRACRCKDDPGAVATCKELDWDPKAETVSCKQTTSYVCKYYGQRFALGSGVWKMEPKVEGQYCTRPFKDHEHLAASCY